MKKFIYTAAALLVLAGSTAPAVTIPSATISAKPKTQPTTEPVQPNWPDTGSLPPCGPKDPNGCGIFD